MGVQAAIAALGVTILFALPLVALLRPATSRS
jgi:hypothetical protein